MVMPPVMEVEKGPETTAQGPDVTSNIPFIEVGVGIGVHEAVTEAAPDPEIFA